jgi:hypothetical protein
MRKRGARVVEHDDIGLARGGAQSAAHHLEIGREALCRTCQHDAADIGAVKTLRQYGAVANRLNFARCQFPQDRIAFFCGRSAINMCGQDAGFAEFVANVDAVIDTRGKDERGLPLRVQTKPMLGNRVRTLAVR